MKVLFLGAGSFSASSFKSLIKHSNLTLKSIDVLTNQPGNKRTDFFAFPTIFLGSELEIVARSLNFKTFHCPTNSLTFPFDWTDYSLGIVSSFSLFIPPRIIGQLPLINIHPSLLPQWRGPAPIQYTLLSGQADTGVSIIDLHPKVIDAGSILIQEPFKITNPETVYYQELEDSLAELGGKLTAQVLANFENYWRNRYQQSGDVSQSKKISKSDGILSFKINANSYETFDKTIRALSHQIPIKSLDLIPNKQIILEDFLLLGNDKTKNEDFWYDKSKNEDFCYDKTKGAVIFKLKDGKFIGIKRFKIEGKSQIFSAGSFYSNFLKTRRI